MEATKPEPLTIGELPIGYTFRMDYFGHGGTRYAGYSYVKKSDDTVFKCGDREWSLTDCGFTPDTPIYGPVWANDLETIAEEAGL